MITAINIVNIYHLTRTCCIAHGSLFNTLWYFMCQLEWPWVPRCLVKHYFWVCLGVLNITWGCFQRWLLFELMNWVKQMALSSVVGHTCLLRAWIDKRLEEGWIFFRPDCLSWETALLSSRPLVLRPSDSDWNLQRCFCGPLAFGLPAPHAFLVSDLQTTDCRTSQPA